MCWSLASSTLYRSNSTPNTAPQKFWAAEAPDFFWVVAKAVTESDWMVICTFMPASLAPQWCKAMMMAKASTTP